jgi:NHLM bacteriocin system ABC transporter peptidase/ATP-binding protein
MTSHSPPAWLRRIWRRQHQLKRARTPTVLQMEAVECGAASLAMVLAYYGRFVSLEELRLACGVTRDGTKASNLLKAARRYGLHAKGFSREPDTLPGLPLPLIVFWNFNHFLVVEGFGRGRVYLNDPASGPRTLDEAEFNESFTGVVLVFQPGPDFVRGGGRASVIVNIGRRLASAWRTHLFVLLASLALVVPGLVVPALVRTFIDAYVVGGQRQWAAPLLLGLALAAGLSAALTWLQQAALLNLENRLVLSSASAFLWHVLRLPVAFFSQRFGGEIGSRADLLSRLANLLSEQAATAFLSAVMVVFFGALMWVYSPGLTLISLAVVTLNLAALRYISRRREDLNRQLLQERGKLYGVAIQALQLIETLKASGAEADFFTRWSGHLARTENVRRELSVSAEFLGLVPSFLTALNTALIVGLGAQRVMDGSLTLGTWVAFQTLAAHFVGPVNSLVWLGGSLQAARGNLERLDDVMRYPLDPQALKAIPDPSSPARLSGQLELREVTFGYSRLDPPLIEGFSLRLNPGERVALVGSSGSGKSTIARLVAGLYEPWAGEILFDHRQRVAWPRASLRHSVSHVSQDISLFEGTVQENLTLWDSTTSPALVEQAARDADLHQYVLDRPGGYAGLVNEAGRNFSGGQRQRLEIARALANNPSILILDEATSALDSLTEAFINKRLRERGCTCLVISHRLSTIRDCDEIIVLEQGRVVQRGTHEALMQADGAYKRLMAAE